MEAPYQSGLRRAASAPSLESLAQTALRLETTPCSVAELHALDDEVAHVLRRTLADTQRELLAAVEAGVLRGGSGGGGGRQYTSDSQEGGSEGEDGASGQGSGRRRSGGSERQRSSSADGGPSTAGGSGVAADVEQELELELAGLSARDREAAIKRARNREAARRSRERKMERIAGLQAEAGRLRSNNFVLLKCVEEVATKALHARAENRQLREKLASLAAASTAAAEAAAAAGAGAASGACTPPPARRAAALERELLLMEAAPGSPTQLLPPLWPDHPDAAAAVAAAEPPARALPTSAELRRELREALAGGSAADQHLLHPSPSAAGACLPHGRRQQQASAGPQQHPAVVQLKQQGSLIRACSAPGSLLLGAATEAGVGPELQPWLNHRGVAA